MNNSNYRRAFTDIVEDVTTSMPLPVITIYKVDVVSAGIFLLYVDDLVYTAINQTLSIGGNPYVVTDLDDTMGNNKITVSGSITPAPCTFNLYRFFFFHGTPVDTAMELGNLKQASNKYPMIWLWEEFSEEMNWDIGEAIDRKTTCSLFFLDQSDPKMSPTDSRWTAYVKPMYKFRDYFMNYLQTQRQDFLIWEQTTKDIPKNKFGVWLAAKGSEKSLFVDNLAGVQMSGTFTIYKRPQDFKNNEFA